MDHVNSAYQPTNPNGYASTDDEVGTRFAETMPPELMKLIIDELPIDSVINLISSDLAMWKVYKHLNDSVPYKTITAIREAVQSDYDTHKIGIALTAIGTEPLMSRPQLLRALAERAHGLARIGPGHDLIEWVVMLTDIETSLVNAFGHEWRGPQLRDLRIADVHARCVPEFDQTPSPVAMQLQQCFRDFPPSMCGDFVETAHALDIALPTADWITFFANVTTLSRPASDTFARQIGLKLLRAPRISKPIIYLENFGITKTQIESIIIPSLAGPLYRNTAHLENAIKGQCRRWGTYAGALKTEVEASIFAQHISGTVISDAAIRLFDGDIVRQDFDPHHIASIKRLEYETIQALGDNPIEVDAFIKNWRSANDPIYTVSEWEKRLTHFTADKIPIVCQPALLDRCALVLKINRKSDMKAATTTAYAWLHTVIASPSLQSRPTLLGRVYVILVRLLDAGSLWPAANIIDAKMQLCTQLFENVASSGWGWMLELSTSGIHGELMTSQERASRFTIFVRDAHASASLPSPLFSALVIEAAVKAWETLPDRADTDRSKFDVFYERFALPEERRASVKKDILLGIVDRATAGLFTLAEGLALGGFDTDPVARRYALKAYHHRPLSLASPAAPIDGQDPDDIDTD